MGLCLSFCRRRRVRDPEREPLLPAPSQTAATDLPPPHSSFEKLADVLAALNVGKLPSQHQLSSVIHTILRLPALDEEGYGPWTLIVRDVRELLQAVQQIGQEKNHDNLVQNILYQSRNLDWGALHLQPEIKETENDIPVSSVSYDLAAFTSASRSLLTVLLTSQAFRLILIDLLTAAREIVTEAAADVEGVASRVQSGAAEVEEAALYVPDIQTAAQGVSTAVKETIHDVTADGATVKERWSNLPEVGRDKARHAFVTRVQEALIEAHRIPKYRNALITLISLLRKYTQGNVTMKHSVQTSPQLSLLLKSFHILVERLASDRSLNPLLDTASQILAEPSDQLRAYGASVASYLDRALEDPKFPASAAGSREAYGLYDAGKSLEARPDMQALVMQINGFLDALVMDGSTQRLVKALDALASATAQISVEWQKPDFVVMTLGWLLPRLLSSVRTLPLPRIEFQNPSLDVAVDALFIRTAGLGASLLPDHVLVQNWSELRVDAVEGPAHMNGSGLGGSHRSLTSTSTRLRVKLDGIRFHAHDIAYYLRYKGPAGIAYSDEGLLGVEVNESGLGVDLQLDLGSETESSLHLATLATNLSGLSLSLARSKHWILNSVLVQPLGGAIVRKVVGDVLEAQIKSAVELLGGVVDDAKGRGGTLGDYWLALLNAGHTSKAQDNQDEEDGEDDNEEPSPHVETHTTATMAGIVRTTLTVPPEDPESTEETVLAVGSGAQLFPNKGGPYDAPSVGQGNVLRSVGESIGEEARKTVGVASDEIATAAQKVAHTRNDLALAEVRKEAREVRERRRRGWRSKVFDI